MTSIQIIGNGSSNDKWPMIANLKNGVSYLIMESKYSGVSEWVDEESICGSFPACSFSGLGD